MKKIKINPAIIALIIGLIIGIILDVRVTKAKQAQDIAKYNDGVCTECEYGQYQLVGKGEDDYCYECDSCHHAIVTYHLMK